MRELYACQLELRETPDAVGVLDLIQEWVARGSGLDVESVRALAASPTVTPDGHELYNTLAEGDRTHPSEWTCSWRHPDEEDAGLVWRILVATGPSPEDAALIRVTLRIRLERAGDRFQLTPLQHSFASPAIIRTLLREHEMTDAGERVNPSYTVRRAGDISALVARLADPTRHLPTVIVTRSPGPTHTVDAGELARAVAGLAHVEVLSTHLAALALTDELDREASVWGGAVRLYWPGFVVGQDLHRHRYWTRARLEATRDFPRLALTLLGSLSAARVPEHPTVAKARARKRPAEADEGTLPPWADEYIEELEKDLDSVNAELTESRAALADALESVSNLEAELGDVRAAFHLTHQAASSDDEAQASPDLENLDVASVFRLAKREASEYIVYLPSADDSIVEFASYNSPRRLYEALTTMSDAAEAWQNGSLGAGFGSYFSERGYEYSQNNPSANARRTRAHYQRRYEGAVVTMEAHLKVDQSTSPDQCLRVYWYRDDANARLVVGHVGRHLPD